PPWILAPARQTPHALRARSVAPAAAGCDVPASRPPGRIAHDLMLAPPTVCGLEAAAPIAANAVAPATPQ
ncbi:hypothetical protein, partial [Xanthomonas translucens]|uniref:hypothetical protein n=1 Tax=Xanthomonas campestris pv. translucens TaxID=343 RepID=UPI001BB0C38C